MTTAQQQARAPDTGDDENPAVPVVMLETVVKALIKDHVPDPRTRHVLWSAYLGKLEQVQESSAFRMPWQEPAEVQEITARHVVAVLVAALRAVQDAIREGTLPLTMPEFGQIRDNLAALAQPVEDYCNGRSAGPGACLCACGCGTLFVPRSQAARYFSDHRQRAYRQRVKAAKRPAVASGQKRDGRRAKTGGQP